MAPTLYDEKPEAGDLIEIFRGSYQHWAVYVGDGFVVHLAPLSEVPSASLSVTADKAIVKIEELWDVVGSNKWKINNSLDKQYKPRLAHVIVRQACEMEGREWQYNVFRGNCEHFANELRYGKMESRQYDEKPEVGDLIEIFRGSYQHWAVYVGDGFVVHLAPLSEVSSASSNSMMSVTTATAIVKKEELWDVVGSNKWEINNSLDKQYKPRPAHVIVRQACAMVGREWQYNVFRGNCEHFTNALRYGKMESRQGREAGDMAAGGFVVGFLAVVVSVGLRIVGLL